MPIIDLTEKEADAIYLILNSVLAAATYDLDQLKEDGYDARTVRAIERVLKKLKQST